jgi:hypothetical protein
VQFRYQSQPHGQLMSPEVVFHTRLHACNHTTNS